MVAEMGFVMLFFKMVSKTFGLFAIRRADTTNYAMSDPDVCGGFAGYRACVRLSYSCVSGRGSGLSAIWRCVHAK